MLNGANKLVSAIFEAQDAKWVREYMEAVKQSYLLQAKLDADLQNIFTKEYRRRLRRKYASELKALKRAEKIISEALVKQETLKSNLTQGLRLSDGKSPHVKHCEKEIKNKRLLIDLIRHEQQGRSVRLTKRPKGNQMNYMLDYSIYWLAENVKEKTGKFHWELIADLISEYLPVEVDANQALKAHKRFAKLRQDRDAFLQVTTANGIDNNWFGKRPTPKSAKCQAIKFLDS